jgi:signal transduction histidine kinase
MIQRTRAVYVVLLAVWVVVVAWQLVEHRRVEKSVRGALINRSKDISSTVGLVLRSQRRFGVISQERLESALTALIKPEELMGVSLLNTRGEVVASAGVPIDLEWKGLVPTGEHWARESVALMNLVDLGTNVTSDIEGNHPTIILSREDMPTPPTNRPAPPPPGPRLSDTNTPPGMGPSTNFPPPGPTPPPQERDHRRGRGEGRPQFGRPFWMSEEEYKAAIEKKGVHSFVMILSTRPLTMITNYDLWLRLVVSAFAGIAVVGFGVAWRNLARTAELEVRLVRASELNMRLKEMNLAAAGLAHETRNPLNIIRGLAQIISRQQDASAEVREKSRNIIDEADRVTAQLNEFINYSRPREVRRTAVNLDSVVGEVARALGSDLEDKAVKLEAAAGLPIIEADEQLLRQALFNLILNAIQAAERGGEIRIAAEKAAPGEIHLDIRDNGPGVPAGQRAEIFKPYVTNHPDGTGLGLAIVQQIATAHGWAIHCLANEPRGAIFRLTHVRTAG